MRRIPEKRELRVVRHKIGRKVSWLVEEPGVRGIGWSEKSFELAYADMRRQQKLWRTNT